MQDDTGLPDGRPYAHASFTLDAGATACSIRLVMTHRQLELFWEAIDTAHGALLSELDACSSNGDDEGATLRWADSIVLEELQQLIATPLGIMERKAAIMATDSAGAEAPSHDATSTSSAHTLASLADGADGDEPSGAVGASGGAQC